MAKRTMTEKVLIAISEAIQQECPDRSAPESALMSAICIKVANAICDDYNRKILNTNKRILETNRQMLELAKSMAAK